MFQSPEGCAIIWSHRVGVLVLLRCSGFTTLHPLRPPFIGLSLGNPHPPLSSLRHGDFRDRENEKSFYVAAVVKPLLHIFSVHSLGGMSHYPEWSGGFLWRPDLASPMPSTRAGSDTVTTG